MITTVGFRIFLPFPKEIPDPLAATLRFLPIPAPGDDHLLSVSIDVSPSGQVPQVDFYYMWSFVTGSFPLAQCCQGSSTSYPVSFARWLFLSLVSLLSCPLFMTARLSLARYLCKIGCLVFVTILQSLYLHIYVSAPNIWNKSSMGPRTSPVLLPKQ